MINAEKSYDSLPNFTAADAMRLLGIGRNQYIDLMNQVYGRGTVESNLLISLGSHR